MIGIAFLAFVEVRRFRSQRNDHHIRGERFNALSLIVTPLLNPSFDNSPLRLFRVLPANVLPLSRAGRQES
jgi:hypothetical protein